MAGMLNSYFGFRENPFSIAPDPDYLFPSERHREALAHLSYGLLARGGFVLLTGEVGTGKTTVCRALLRQLQEPVEVAMILNPSLTVVEMLAAICDEWQLHYEPGTTSLKDYVDRISQRLLANFQDGRRSVLLVDEAQHLQPEVLEQLRLLTNLETDQQKLLHVVLIGQPELQQNLRLPALRQLAQRITARYHLLPLTASEVGQYIQHRLQVAGCGRPLFSRGALRQIHKYSGGVPRLINLLCDRALLLAVNHNASQVDGSMAVSAAADVLGEPAAARTGRRWLTPAVVVLCLAVAGWWGRPLLSQLRIFGTGLGSVELPAKENHSVAIAVHVPAVVAADQGRQSDPAVAGSGQFSRQEWLTLIAGQQHPAVAMQNLLKVWGYQASQAQASCASVAAAGLACSEQQGTLGSLLMLNYPVVVAMRSAEGQAYYATVVAMSAERVELLVGEQHLEMDREPFERQWLGRFTLFWPRPEGFDKYLMEGQRGPLVSWLEAEISLALGEPSRAVARFDAVLADKVSRFQMQHGLKMDGIAGERTLMVLAQLNHAEYPRLTP